MSEEEKITKEMPLKLEGEEIGEVYILPRGYKGDNPMEQLSQNLAKINELKNKLSELTKTNEDLASKNEKLEEENKSLIDKLNVLESVEVKKVAEEVADMRIKASLSTEDKKEEDVKTLMALGTEKLSMLKEDYETLSENKPESAGRKKEKLEEGDSNEEKEQKLRMELFGHKELIKEGD